MKIFRRLILLPVLSLILGCGSGGGGGGGGGGGSIGITPVAATPRFTLVANRAEGTLSLAAVDSANGSWRHISYFSTGLLPSSVATNPAGTRAYVANTGSDTVSGFSISSSGVLAEVPGSPFATGLDPAAVAVEATGKYCYVANYLSNSISAFWIDLGTGALTPVTGSPFATGARPVSISIDPTGAFLYSANSASDNVSMFQINGATGALVAVAGSPIAAGIAPHTVAVDASGRYVYVSNAGTNTVSAYGIQGGGGLVPIAGSPFATGSSPAGVSSDALGKFLYVANNASDTVSGFSIGAGGVLTPLAGSPFATAAGPDNLAADPSGLFLYAISAATNVVSRFSINGSTGVLTAATSERGRTAFAMTITKGASASFLPRFLYTSNATEMWGFSVNPATGALTTVPGSTFDPAHAFASDPLGRYLYATGPGTDGVRISSIDAATGELTFITAFALNSAFKITVDPTSRFVYVSNFADDQVSAYAIDQSDGTLTELSGSPYGAGSGPLDVEVDPTGRFLYVTNVTAPSISGYEIDPATGELTEISGSPFAWTGDPGGEARGIAIDPSGRLAYVSSSTSQEFQVYSIDSVTGAMASLSLEYLLFGGLVDVAMDPLNRYVYSTGMTTGTGLHAFAITTPETGALTLVPSSPYSGSAFVRYAVVDPSGKFLYANNFANTFLSAFAINPSSGALAEILGSPYATGQSASGLFVTRTIQ